MLCNAWKISKTILHSFLNPINAAKHMGLFNIISAKVVEVKELAPNDVEAFSRIQIYKEKYHQVAAYYVGVNYSVYEESKYY